MTVDEALATWIVRTSSAKTLARLEETIAPLPPDPRVGEALVAFVEAPPFQALSTRPLWEAVLTLLPRHVDAAQPSLRHLREIDTLPLRLLHLLATATPPFALTRIACDAMMGSWEAERDAALIPAFEDGRGLPHLVELELHYVWGRVAEHAWLGTTQIGRQLETLSTRTYDSLRQWLERVRALDKNSRLRTLRLRGYGWAATLTRPWDALALEVVDDARATAAIAELEARSLATLTVTGARSKAFDAAAARVTR